MAKSGSLSQSAISRIEGRKVGGVGDGGWKLQEQHGPSFKTIRAE